MKLYQSRTLANLDLFAADKGLMKQSNDIFLLWKVCEFYQPASILEIGFFAGQSFGFMFEATDSNAVYQSVDIDYTYKKVFDQVFHNDPKLDQIKFFEIDSKQFLPTQQFDFVHVDGDHSYDYATHDIQKCLPLLHKGSILCIDDYHLQGVHQAIIENLLGQNDFIPFLAGDQEMFFHHKSHSADVFLDDWIQQKSCNFMDFSNYEFYGFTVLKATTPHIFVEHPNMFYQAVQLYKL